jgi:hypothetical protein
VQGSKGVLRPDFPEIWIWFMAFDAITLGLDQTERPGGFSPKLQSLFRRLSTPGDFSPKAVLSAGIVAMVAIFIIDLIAPKDVRLHLLYVFPLAAIALHCERKRAVIGALILASAF